MTRYSYNQFIRGFRNEMNGVYPRTEEEAYKVAITLKENGVKSSWYGIGQILAFEYIKNGKF